jgi:hypothetical protein
MVRNPAVDDADPGEPSWPGQHKTGGLMAGELAGLELTGAPSDVHPIYQRAR